jgi:hypothetical protein
MKQIAKVPIVLLALALIIASGTAWALQNGITLTLDGKVISTDIQTIKGRAYVPVSDVATALDRMVVKKGAAYSLTRSEASPQIQGTLGKMSTNVLPGKWQLHVASVQEVAGYSPQFGSDKETITPKETNDILVVIKCQLKNGTKQMQEVSFDTHSSRNTALMDDQEHGYVPLAYDSRNSGYTSAKMPSGTTHDFVVIFSVPKGINLKDLIYSIGGYSMDKNPDFRVSLNP